ncbi:MULTISPECIES: adenosylcobinamide-GDP ribazoletransferase [unclassified Bacillus (in: firmicutes)]|uniref:adenosylcobinamide-GDP ribazoletransferase n=1 Tax=unclassified Bacillus (in: firmicutes) TaxID=185979 RepID=UPI000BF19344|nr:MULTISPECIES: adenosylcobinamide-GDP ribazoletransferase [unclassified Bacillus (in: firmicutes)]PEJ56186.1 adenosylcobinamide-GDP ribazoletransferase [Bacillus sp. AFS002410]PEL05178.1 adenosylcobinamide-GDP ribazoletransferase [Bacillus sp. AFS017336]
MNRFKMILSFFSTIPVKNYEFIEAELGKGIRLVPLVGVLFGILLVCLNFGISLILDNEANAFLILIVYLFLTGGLHFDGVADTSDGIFSHRSKERILEIMKDSRIGAFGVISLIILFLGDWIFLSKNTTFVIFLFPIIGRCIALFTCRISTYARNEGFGSQFIIEAKKSSSLVVLIGYIILICLGSIYFNEVGIIFAICVTFVFIGFVTKRINQKIDGITGDVIGFTIEISQLCFLIFAVIGERLV